MLSEAAYGSERYGWSVSSLLLQESKEAYFQNVKLLHQISQLRYTVDAQIQYLIIDEQLSGGVQALHQHQFVRLFGNSVRQRRPDPPLRGPQPQAHG